MTRPAIAAALVALGAGGACRSLNYDRPGGPRYVAPVPPSRPAPGQGDSLLIRVVTFNVRDAGRIDRVIALLRSSGMLQRADIIALQEMDAAGTRQIAEALAMAYVYYPATVSWRTGRDFGNAILSRWPIVADEKVVLPHLGRFRRTTRTATAATIAVRGAEVRVYSVHLGTRVEIGPGSRRDQAQAILANAAPYPRVVIGGDMNSRGIGRTFRDGGFEWPTEHNPVTHLVFNWDHIFYRGFAPADHAGAGVVRDRFDASDHRPVWAVAKLARLP